MLGLVLAQESGRGKETKACVLSEPLGDLAGSGGGGVIRARDEWPPLPPFPVHGVKVNYAF